MGFKRPFDDEEFQELPYKHSRQIDIDNKLTQFSDFGPCDTAPQKHDISCEEGGGLHKPQQYKASKNDAVTNEFTNSADKDFEISAPLSLVTTRSSEEDAGSRPTAHASLSLEHFEYDFSRRTFVSFEDSYSSALDCSPRKQVPVGPNHQATLPSWDNQMTKNILEKATLNGNNSVDYLGSDNIVDDDNEEKFMGTCVVPLPDSSSSADNMDKVGPEIMDCECLDGGFIRCVQQHVMEARQELLKSLGHEKFVKLGFCDMGEEVSCTWSEEEEQVFHEVVYSNPVSLVRNFWKHLSAVFPSRTKKEIVSYYFNVFMLRRRAVQNRSDFLDIDSDDDEWHGNYGGTDVVQILEEDDDSAIESPVNHEEQGDCGEDSSDEEDNDGDNSDGDVGGGGVYATRDCCVMDHVSEASIVKSFDEGGLDAVVPHVDKIPDKAADNYNVEDDSCTSFEFQPDLVDSCGAVDAGHALQISGVKTDRSKHLYGKLDRCSDPVGSMNLLDPGDAKVWDARYPSPIKGIDLLPTCNMIEEIFGQGTWDTKTRND